jgi:hypothetical protein
VNEKQLKSVKWFDGPAQTSSGSGELQAGSSSAAADLPFITTPREGSSMRMRLMQRPKITTLALPRSHTWPSDLISPHQAPFHFLPDVYNYAKFMLATPAYLISDFTRDVAELSAERHVLASMDDHLGICFVDAADEKLRHQIANATALETPALKDAIDKAVRDQREIEQRVSRMQCRGQEESAAQTESSEVPEALLAVKSGGALFPTGISTTVSNLDASSPSNRSFPRQRRNLNPPPPSTSTYYFYQAASGLPIFLHPLDSRILLSHFSGYQCFPDTITVRVESVSEGTVNDDLRKRCKYLAHMPESADVVFVEADLAGVVGDEGLKNFEVALKTRRSRRKEKERKDDRARARAEEREREKEKEQVAPSWNNTNRSALSPVLDIPDPVEEPSPVARQLELPGAWGARSFASALHSAPSQERVVSQQRSARLDPDNEWDMDVAWHELEQRSGGGRKKRSNKLVVLGGAGGRRR